MAVVAFSALTNKGGTALNAGICVGVAVLIMILGANIPLLGAIPASVYGCASTAALFLRGGAAYGEGPGGIVMVGVAFAVSMMIGNLLGYISDEIVGALTKKLKYSGGCAHVQPQSVAGPIDNHTCHCNLCKNVTGQLKTHVVFFKHGNLQVTHEGNLNRQPFNGLPSGAYQLFGAQTEARLRLCKSRHRQAAHSCSCDNTFQIDTESRDRRVVKSASVLRDRSNSENS